MVFRLLNDFRYMGKLAAKSTECEQGFAVLFEPCLRGGALRMMLLHQLPKGAAVVGVAQVAEFVDAHIILHAIGGANQPPVEFDACACAAYAPKGFAAS